MSYKAKLKQGRSRHARDVDNRIGERFGRFLRQVVPDIPVHILVREMMGRFPDIRVEEDRIYICAKRSCGGAYRRRRCGVRLVPVIGSVRYP